jgi:hypothetical protein
MIDRLKFALLTVICALGVACGGGGSGNGGFLSDDGGNPLQIDTNALPALAQVPYAEVLEASGGREPYSWTMVNDDGTGLTLDSSGVLRASAGVQPGQYAITIRVSDDAGASVDRSLTIEVTLAPLAISTTALPAAPEGVAYSAILEVEGGEAPFDWELVSDAGTGLTISSADGLLTGAPATPPGTYGLTFRVTDSNGLEDRRSLLLQVTGDTPGPLAIITTTLPGASEGEQYAVVLEAEGGSGDYSWRLISAGNSGFGLTETGILGSNSPVAGSYGLTFEVNDGFNVATRSLVIEVSGEDTVPPSITTSSLDPAFVGVPYAAVLEASPPDATLSWTLVDAGGTGFSVSSAGVLSGVASENGTFPITVRVTDSRGDSDTAPLILQVGAPQDGDSLAIATAALPDGTQGQSYAVILRAFGGDGSNTWSVREDLDGSTLNFTGVADQAAGLLTSAALPGAGTYTVLIEVRDGSDGVDIKEFTFEVNAP